MRRSVNWGWLWTRWLTRDCRHEWTALDLKGHRACQRCGVWQWFLLAPAKPRGWRRSKRFMAKRHTA